MLLFEIQYGQISIQSPHRSASHISSLSVFLGSLLTPGAYCICFLTRLPPFPLPDALLWAPPLSAHAPIKHSSPQPSISDNFLNPKQHSFKISLSHQTKNAGLENETQELLHHKSQIIVHLRSEMRTLLPKRSLNHFQYQSTEVVLMVQRESHGFGIPELETFLNNASCRTELRGEKNKTNTFHKSKKSKHIIFT